MLFHIHRTSDDPVAIDGCVERTDDSGVKYSVIEINSIDDLLSLCRAETAKGSTYGEIIVSLPFMETGLGQTCGNEDALRDFDALPQLEIYDDYRE